MPLEATPQCSTGKHTRKGANIRRGSIRAKPCRPYHKQSVNQDPSQTQDKQQCTERSVCKQMYNGSRVDTSTGFHKWNQPPEPPYA